MKVLLAMAGEGKRFSSAGYQTAKPAILIRDRRTGEEMPMVVAAVRDLPGVLPDGSNVLFIDRDFHKTGGVEKAITAFYPAASFLTLHGLTEGQASTCLLAASWIGRDDELLIAGCDNGMEMDEARFCDMKNGSDLLVFTYRHHAHVTKNPAAYGWIRCDEQGFVQEVSVKKPISLSPMENHAISATFWYREGSVFLRSVQHMIDQDDRINGEFYIDQSVAHAVQLGYRVRVFEIERYFCWGTPDDYENYSRTLKYWRDFAVREQIE